MAPDLDTEMRVFVRLVRRGVLTEDAVRPLFQQVAAAQAAGKPVSLAGMAVKRGLIDKAAALLYLRTDGEDVPELPGWTYVSKLGEGGTAHVFRVQRKDARTQEVTTRAVKILKPEIAADPAEVKAFLAEARLLASLEHDNIVKGDKAGRLAGRWISFMEDIPGETLLERIQSGGCMAEDDALYVILQTARALEYLRSQGVVHRDIKPGNIMVTEDHAVKLIDLGFAAQSGGEDGAQAEGTTRGTAAYLSPEQARGEGGLDVRSDIYSLGATLYQLVLGALPFEGDDADLVRAAVLEGLSAEATKGGGLSPYVHYFIEKMMAKDRDHRYQDPAELIADIEAQIEGRRALDMPEEDTGEADADKARRKLDRLRRKRQRRR